jgi:hypothetical protein
MLLLWVALVGCHGDPPGHSEADSAADSASPDDSSEPTDTRTSLPLHVVVTLDGKPVEGATVMQGGLPDVWTTAADGSVDLVADLTVNGDEFIIAAHPEARTSGDFVSTDEKTLSIALTRFSPIDNEAYVFRHPGTPEINATTAYCAHCHMTMVEDWYASPHRESASNVVVHDVYAGAAGAVLDEASCTAVGGRWSEGIGPGTGKPAFRCYVGEGVLPALNPGCDASGSCDDSAEDFGACADCHAPGIDGELGGRSLLEATDIAYDYGVHCDVCHHVESIDLEASAGVAGRLQMLRPSEPTTVPGLGDWVPLMFGPWPDVPTSVMGGVERELFHDGSLCSGCHQLDQEVLVPGATIDLARWPDGRLPVHTTYLEWKTGPFGETDVTCAACHMPPDPDVGNGADLGNMLDVEPGLVAGWYRPPGSVKKHAWYGPRQPESGMLELAAWLSIDASVEKDRVVASVTVTNVGCGHALPTGEPLRSMLLFVEATCDGDPLAAIGGAAVPDFGGWLDEKLAGDDWTHWPGAAVGDVVRVVRRTGAFYDYEGYGPFGDGTFDAIDKGMPIEEVVGESTIVAMAGDVATFEPPLPSGDVAYRGDGSTIPQNGDPVTARAGAAGFGFARVLVGDDGERMVPHYEAVDVASDNRILPQDAWVSEHAFTTTCADPQIHAVLVHRPLPVRLSRERSWGTTDAVMAEAWW